MDPEENFTALQDGIFTSIMASVQTTGRIAAQDISFHRTSNSDFNGALDETSARILGIANQLLKSASRGSDLSAPKITDIDDVETKWGEAIEIVDFMLEKADTCLDEYTGAIKHKNPEPLPGALMNTSQRPGTGRGVQKATSWQSRQMAKPQLKFDDEINNFDDTPFRPILKTKPHAVVPLEDSIRLEPNQDGIEQFTHPYQTEIEAMEYPPQIYENKEPIMYLPFEETTATWVDTKESLEKMIDELKKASEIAVDLEHHDTRSYIGFTCLMQISTRNNDWIIDTLSLRSELQALNEVFANPKIIKVLHGCYMDVKWLQRDFGLYLVGLFDTHFAAKVLGFQGLGLAFLLKKYIDFNANKQFQLADWRIRPLTPEMFDYARSDTHFLLYIFDCVRNELVDRSDPENPEEDRIQRVLQDSREAALKRYEREVYDAEGGYGNGGWFNAVYYNNFNNVETEIFKAIHQWRDTTAREEDDSPHFILPKHQMTKLTRQPPTTVSQLLAICTPTSSAVKARAGELLSLIIHTKKNTPALVPNNSRPSPETVPAAPAFPFAPVAEFLAPAAKTRAPPPPPPPKKESRAPVAKYAVERIFESTPAAIPEIHAEKSAFWGGTFGSSKWAARTAETGVSKDVRLAIPLPQLTAAVFVTAEERGKPVQKSVDPGARAEHEYVRAADRRMKKEEDIIVVKSLGGPRKRKHENSTDGDERRQSGAAAQKGTENVEDLQGAARENLEDGSARKKFKEEVQHGNKTQDDQGFQGFDYSKAPPVFNSHKQQKAAGKDGRQQKKKPAVFDPYTKSGDAPRGMSRGQRERSGKSHTFKQ